jgi:uroporphyrinogen decarboxylase
MLYGLHPVAPKGAMSSRERVRAAAKGEATDRVPVMYYLNPHAACRLMAEYQPARDSAVNFQARFLWNRLKMKNVFQAREIWRLLPHSLNEYASGPYPLELGADIALEPVGAGGNVKRLYWDKGKARVLDAYGSIRGLGGIYMDIIKPAINDVSELKDYRFPDYTDDKHYAAIRKTRRAYPEACIMFDDFGVQDFFSTQIWSMTPFMMALFDHPAEVKAYLQRFGDWAIDVARRGLKAGADMVFVYDDYGYTGRPFISMDMWKEFTYPHLKRIIAAIHDAGGLVMLHSCGLQTPFLEYYIEAGLDILQAFQPKAGNNFAESYAKYGDRLTFATGIDVQLGEQMTPSEIRQSILDSYHIGKRRGRHILGMTHMLQYTMPAENISAIFDTVREIQADEHG